MAYFPSLKSLLTKAILYYFPPLPSYPPMPLMDEEAFPGADDLFCKAFGLSDPTPELLSLIKAHPTEAAVRDLLIAYILEAKENPSRAYALASVLVALRDSPDAPNIEDLERVDDYSLAVAFRVKLADLHSRYLIFDDDNKTVSPTNTYLTNCLLSALSLKHNLAWCPAQYHEIKEGLIVQGHSWTGELLLTGACIQLLTIGSKIVSDRMFYSGKEVATKHRLQHSAGIVKAANARKLLDVCQLFLHYN